MGYEIRFARADSPSSVAVGVPCSIRCCRNCRRPCAGAVASYVCCAGTETVRNSLLTLRVYGTLEAKQGG